MSNTTYLFSSFLQNPEFFFQGYCFIGSDYIFGELGAREYVQNTNEEIIAGQDGCYITVKKSGENFVFGSDYSGYKKILYFKDPVTESWAVSNSLKVLVEHLRENSIEVTPNFPLIKLMSQIETSTQQLVTYSTIANEIQLLPLNTTLEIGPKTLIIHKIEYDDNKTYEELIYNFVEVWSSRFATMMSNESLNITQALTGGLDSRAIFALSNLAKQSLPEGISSKYKLICGLTKGERVDLDIAEEISEYYGYTLNDKNIKDAKLDKLNVWQNYMYWKDISLGLYRPIYFPNSKINPYSISIGGGGGETFKPAYGNYMKPNNFSGLINNLRSKVDDDALEIHLENDLKNTLNKLVYINEAKDLDHLILHCVHFRTRFHAGLFPQYKVAFTPLSSSYLQKMFTKEFIDKVNSSQVLYDLISFMEGLLDFSYDYRDKEPTTKNIDNLIDVDKPLNISIGKVYIGNKNSKVLEDENPNGTEFKSPLELLQKNFNQAREKKLVQSIWGEEFISNAEKVLNEAISNKRFRYASDANAISAILATGIFEA